MKTRSVWVWRSFTSCVAASDVAQWPHTAYCCTKPRWSKTAQKRLQVLRDSNDGFVIAQQDLEIRGPGELLGTRQTGNAEFKVADLLRDQGMIPEVQRLARQYP
ncbi:ATP-dependent DNA helicase recG [Leclercia adecarboxylata]|uniref:ATP-dependent DNA helicase recG n=1 Tax=Leclercia adecarboxylata TaxID=83655 RepID=A0A4U9HDN5_9ENTR|nr:ATP-dependent DNA helicase recG [Leclercia adecarboxylata]